MPDHAVRPRMPIACISPSAIFCGALHPRPHSDGRYDGFVTPAVSAIVDPQIKAGLSRFDTGQDQWLAAFGAGRPKVIDKRKIERIYHRKI
jgi:hypothetical protein